MQASSTSQTVRKGGVCITVYDSDEDFENRPEPSTSSKTSETIIKANVLPMNAGPLTASSTRNTRIPAMDVDLDASPNLSNSLANAVVLPYRNRLADKISHENPMKSARDVVRDINNWFD